MADLIMMKRLGALRPVGDEGEEALRILPADKLLKVKISQPRSLPWLRRYWALVGLVAENSSYSREDVHVLLKIRCGCSRLIQERNGNILTVPDSISFDRMQADAWAVYWNRVVDYVASDLLPGISRKELERELIEIAGLPMELAK